MLGLEVAAIDQVNWCELAAQEQIVEVQQSQDRLSADKGNPLLGLRRYLDLLTDLIANDYNSNGIIDREDISRPRDPELAAKILADVIKRDEVSIVAAGEIHGNEPIDIIYQLIAEIQRQGKQVIWALEVDHHGYEDLIAETNEFIDEQGHKPCALEYYAKAFKEEYLKRKQKQFEHDLETGMTQEQAAKGWKLAVRDASRFASTIKAGAHIQMLDDFRGRQPFESRDSYMHARLRYIMNTNSDSVVIASVGSIHSQVKDRMLDRDNYPDDPTSLTSTMEKLLLSKAIKTRRLEPQNVLAQQLSNELGDRKVLSVAFIPANKESFHLGKPSLRHDAWEVVIPSHPTDRQPF